MKKNTRIYCSQKLILSSKISLEKKQSHYIKNVMRLEEGNFLSLFEKIMEVKHMNPKNTTIVKMLCCFMEIWIYWKIKRDGIKIKL